MSELLNELSARFDTKEVKQRSQGGKRLDYIGIDATIRRFNEVLGAGWSTDWLTHSLIPVDGGKYLAIVSLTLSALEKQAVGIGADVAADPDKALKTALAEALKKAGHQYGVGLYLWDEEEREIIQRDRQAANGDINALKAKAFELALSRGAEPNAKSVSETLGIKEEELQNELSLKSVLGIL